MVQKDKQFIYIAELKRFVIHLIRVLRYSCYEVLFLMDNPSVSFKGFLLFILSYFLINVC